MKYKYRQHTFFRFGGSAEVLNSISDLSDKNLLDLWWDQEYRINCQKFMDFIHYTAYYKIAIIKCF